MIKIPFIRLLKKSPISVNLSEKGGRKFGSYQYKDKDLGKLTVDTDLKFALARENPSKSCFPGVYETKIRDEKGQCIGFEMFEFSNNNEEIPSIIGEEIFVRRDLQKNGKRFGEKLRLSSIIAMLENNINRILITSVPDAILFHTKYKFKPVFADLWDCKNILRNILMNSYEDTKHFGPQAEKLMEKINAENFGKKEDILKSTSELFENFVNVLQNLSKEKQNEYPFFQCVDMRLTREDVIKNAEYFNGLLKKHNLDYKI